MAVGGMGDVLSGILGALFARGLTEFETSRAGVFLHGRAGDLSMSLKGGNTADDLIAALPRAMLSL
jgi:ADP-dependent NAD(P)H-hydrate dehydratase / NAD(P)H-hydrate epimerase